MHHYRAMISPTAYNIDSNQQVLKIAKHQFTFAAREINYFQLHTYTPQYTAG